MRHTPAVTPRSLGFLGALGLVLAAAGPATAQSSPTNYQVTVRTRLNVRQGPGIDQAKIMTLENGTIVTPTTKQADGWWKVEQGWVHSAFLRPARGTEWRVTVRTGLKLRKGPGLKHLRLGILPTGATVRFVAKGPGLWWKVTSGGRTGWVNSSYLASVAHPTSGGSAPAAHTTSGGSAPAAHPTSGSVSVPPGSNRADAIRAKVAQWAVQQADDPTIGYSQTKGRFGNVTDSQGRRYFDCSGLVSTAYKQFGTTLGGNWTGAMLDTWRGWADQVPKDPSVMKPGDLILMKGHVVMYIGNGRCVGAQTSNTAYPDQVTTNIDVNRYLARADAIVLRPRV